MKVILKEYVYMHGVAGDIVDVANGFARNYLIPQGKAVKATPEAIERSEALVAEATIRREELNDQLVALADKIQGTELIFGRRAERNDKLYGSVTTMDIADSLLAATGIDINRRRISERPLREIGEFEVPIRMGHDLAPVVKVIIVREEELEDFLKARETAQSALEAGEVVGDKPASDGVEEVVGDEPASEVVEEEVVAESLPEASDDMPETVEADTEA